MEGKMQSATLKKEAKKAIDKLSEEKVRVAIDFIDYLKEKEEMEATLEILSSRELMAQRGEAENAIKKGKLHGLCMYSLMSSLKSTMMGIMSYLYTEDLFKPSSKSFRKVSSYKSVALTSDRIESILSFLKGLNLTRFVLSLSNNLVLSFSVNLSMRL